MTPLTKDKIKPGKKIRHIHWANGTYAIILSAPYFNGSGIEVFDATDSGSITGGYNYSPHHYMVLNCEQYWSIIDEGISFNEVTSVVDPNRSNVRQEKPCQVCQKKNDIGVKVCWSCGNQP